MFLFCLVSFVLICHRAEGSNGARQECVNSISSVGPENSTHTLNGLELFGEQVILYCKEGGNDIQRFSSTCSLVDFLSELSVAVIVVVVVVIVVAAAAAVMCVCVCVCVCVCL